MNVGRNGTSTYHVRGAMEDGQVIVPESQKIVHCNHVHHDLRVSQQVTEAGHNPLSEMLTESEIDLRQHILRYKTNKVHILTIIAPITLGVFMMDVQYTRRLGDWTWG